MLSKNRNQIKKKSIFHVQSIFLPFATAKNTQQRKDKQKPEIQTVRLIKWFKHSSQKNIKHIPLAKHFSHKNFDAKIDSKFQSKQSSFLTGPEYQTKARSKTFAQKDQIFNQNSKKKRFEKQKHRSASVKSRKILRSKSKNIQQTKLIDGCIHEFLCQQKEQGKANNSQKKPQTENKQGAKSNIFFMKIKPHAKSKNRQEYKQQGFFQKSDLLRRLQLQRRKLTKQQQLLKEWEQIPDKEINKQMVQYKSLYMLQQAKSDEKKYIRSKKSDNSRIVIQDYDNLSQQSNKNQKYLIKVSERYVQMNGMQSNMSQEQISSVSTIKTQREQKIIIDYLQSLITNKKINQNSRRKINYEQAQPLIKKNFSQVQDSLAPSKKVCIEQKIFQILSTFPKNKKPLPQEDSDSQSLILKNNRKQQQTTIFKSLDIKTNCLFSSKKFILDGFHLVRLKKIVVRPFIKKNIGFYIDFWLQILGQQVVRRIQWEIQDNKQKPQGQNQRIRELRKKSQIENNKKHYQPWQRKIKKIFCKIFAESRGKNLLKANIIQRNNRINRGIALAKQKLRTNKKKVTIMEQSQRERSISVCSRELSNSQSLSAQPYQAKNEQFDKQNLTDIIGFIQGFTQMNRDYTGYFLFGMESKYAFYRQPVQCFQINFSNKKPIAQMLIDELLIQHFGGAIGDSCQQIPIERYTITSAEIARHQVSEKQLYCILKLADSYFMAKLLIKIDFQKNPYCTDKAVNLFLISNFTSNTVCQNFDDIKKVINNIDQIFKGYYKDIDILKERIKNQSKILLWKNKKRIKMQNACVHDELEDTIRKNFQGFGKYVNNFIKNYAQQISEKSLINNKAVFHTKLFQNTEEHQDEENNRNLLKTHNRNESENKQTYIYWPNSNFIFTDPSITNFFVYHQSFDYGYHLHDNQFIQGHCDGIYYTIQRLKTKIQLDQIYKQQRKTNKDDKFQSEQKKIKQTDVKNSIQDSVTPTYIVRVWEKRENYAFVLDNQFQIEQFLILHIPEIVTPMASQFYKKCFIQRHRKRIRNSKKINEIKKDNYFIGQDIEQKNKHQEIKAHNRLFPYIGGFDDDIVNSKKSVNFELVKDKNIKVHVRMISGYLLMQFTQLKSEKVWKFYCPMTTYHEINKIFNKKIIGTPIQDQQQSTDKNRNRKIKNKKPIQRNSLVKNYQDSFKQIRSQKFRKSKRPDSIKQNQDSQNDQTYFLPKFSGVDQLQKTEQFLNLLRKQKKIVYSGYIIGDNRSQKSKNQRLICLPTERKINDSIQDVQSMRSIQTQKNNQYYNFETNIQKIKKFQYSNGNQSLSTSFQYMEKKISNAYIGKIYQVFHKKTIKICHGVFIVVVICKIINYGLYELKFYLSKTRKMYFCLYSVQDSESNIDFDMNHLTQFLRDIFFKRYIDKERQKRIRRYQQQLSHLVGLAQNRVSNVRQKRSTMMNRQNMKTQNSIGLHNLTIKDLNIGSTVSKKAKVLSKVKNALMAGPRKRTSPSSFINASNKLINFATIARTVPSLQLKLHEECISQYFVSPRGNSYFIRISYNPTKDAENYNKFPIQKQEVCIELYRQNMFTYLHYFVPINSIITQTARQRKFRKKSNDKKTDETQQDEIVSLIHKNINNDSLLGMKKLTPNDWRYLLYKIKLKICKSTKHQKIRQISRVLRKMTDHKFEKKDWIHTLKNISTMKRQTVKIQATSQYCLMIAKNLVPRMSSQDQFLRRDTQNYSIYLQNRETKQIQLINDWNGSFSSCVPLNKVNSKLFRRMCRQVKKNYCDRIIEPEWDSGRSYLDQQKLRQKIYDLFGNLINKGFQQESSQDSL